MPFTEQIAKNRGLPSASLNASAFAPDTAAGRVSPEAKAAHTLKRAELMTPKEFRAALGGGQVQQATGKYTEAEQEAETPLARGEAAGYSSNDIAAFYAARCGGDWRHGAYDLVKDAHAGNRPINRSLWDAVVKRAPRGYVRDGELYRPARRPPEGFVARKAVAIPAWATIIALVANGIDGWPPVSDGVYSVEQFLKVAGEIQRRPGAGEWDVLVYAMDSLNTGLEVHPYGLDNPYRRLRSAHGHRAQQIARFSYMRWHWYDFATPSVAGVDSLKAPAQESEAWLRPARR